MIEVAQNGVVLCQYNWRGRSYLSVSEGPCDIRLTNPMPVRQKVVLSVDGLNALTSEPAGFDGPGYVLRAGESVIIPGFRVSSSLVEKFKLRKQGVIGAAFFVESPSAKNFDKPFREEPVDSSLLSDPQVLYTSETSFTAASRIPQRVFKLQYGLGSVLTEWGVPIPTHPPEIDPFPAQDLPRPSSVLKQ